MRSRPFRRFTITMKSGERCRRPRGQQGAAAVEFALISVVFFPLLFGMLQYGLYFFDSVNVRQGVREAARQGVVEMPLTDSCGTAGITWTKLGCYTEEQVGAVTGDTQVHFKLPDSSGWKKQNRLVVCAAVQSDGGIGLFPMPRGGVITSVTQMSIEQDSAPPSGNPPNTDSDPSGDNWSWC